MSRRRRYGGKALKQLGLEEESGGGDKRRHLINNPTVLPEYPSCYAVAVTSPWSRLLSDHLFISLSLCLYCLPRDSCWVHRGNSSIQSELEKNQPIVGVHCDKNKCPVQTGSAAPEWTGARAHSSIALSGPPHVCTPASRGLTGESLSSAPRCIYSVHVLQSGFAAV